MPPSDPRYLEMTDDDIIFDFHTQQAFLEIAGEDEDNPAFRSFEEARIKPAPVPEGGARHMEFRADEEEFKDWYEENIGSWSGD